MLLSCAPAERGRLSLRSRRGRPGATGSKLEDLHPVPLRRPSAFGDGDDRAPAMEGQNLHTPKPPKRPLLGISEGLNPKP